MVTTRVFKVGNSQAVRIPARYRFSAQEVEVFQRDGDLILRPKRRTAADVFARIRARGADYSDWQRPQQGRGRPAPSLD